MVRVFAVSDLHTDEPRNAQLVEHDWAQASAGHGQFGSDSNNNNNDDVLIVAGDISSKLHVLRRTLVALTASRRWCHVFFCPGNSELRLEDWRARRKRRGGDGVDPALPADSLEKLEAVLALCAELGVHTRPHLIPGGSGGDGVTNNAGSAERSVLVVPLLAWYTPFFEPSFAGSEDFGPRSYQRRWLDFRTVHWPSREVMLERCREVREGLHDAGTCAGDGEALMADAGPRKQRGSSSPSSSPSSSSPSLGSKASLSSLHDSVVQRGENLDGRESVATVSDDDDQVDVDALPARLLRLMNEENMEEARALLRESGGSTEVVTFSHFLPRRELVPRLAKASLALVAGDSAIDDQLRELGSAVHVFGHTHWQSDGKADGVRYVQNPVGHHNERTGVLSKSVSAPLLVLDSAQRGSGGVAGWISSWFRSG